MESRKTTDVVLRPRDSGGMQAGIHNLAGLLRSTLGPHGRVTASAAVGSNSAPELFESGGLIARRMFEFPDAEQNVGAMFLRDVLLRVYDIGGDGVATASVVFQGVFDEGIRELAGGADPSRLQHFLRQGLKSILEDLDCQRLDTREGDTLIHIARTICADPDLAEEISRLFTIVGQHGSIEVRSGQGDALKSTLIEGAYWDGTVHESLMLLDQAGRRADVNLCALFVSDLDITEPADMARILELAKQLPVSGIFIIARRISTSATAVLMTNSTPSFRAYGVRLAGGDTAQQVNNLADLSILSGARLFRVAAGDSIASLQISDFGHSRRAWITRTQFGVIAPSGNSQSIRRHVTTLRQRYATVADDERAVISRRLSRLTSSSAIVWVSGPNVDAIDRRMELARRTITALRGAMSHGALPGGGAALLACKPRLKRDLLSADDPDQQAALRILIKGVEAPARAIAANSGREASVAVDRAEQAGSGCALNVITGAIEDVCRTGILDSYMSHRIAIQCAISGAAQALTIDTLVMHQAVKARRG
jgi:chaperonin GroEL